MIMLQQTVIILFWEIYENNISYDVIDSDKNHIQYT